MFYDDKLYKLMLYLLTYFLLAAFQ